MVDGFIAIFIGGGWLGTKFMGDRGLWLSLAVVFGCGLAVSLLNQVVLTRIIGASVGKLLLTSRVVREEDARRPGVLRLTQRWLAGLAWLLFQCVLYPLGLDDESEDMCGVRIVRAHDLRAVR